MSESPAYARLASLLREQITSGRYGPGDRLPSETQLMGQHHLSRNTVRAAVRTLVDAGMVTRRRGSGCYVSKHSGITHSLGSLRSITEVINDLGLTPGIRAITLAVDPRPSPELHGFLRSEPVWMLSRTRLASGTPFALMDSWLPDDLGRVLDVKEIRKHQSLYRTIAQTGLRVVAEATEAISAEGAGPREAAALDVPIGSPLLVLHRFTTDRNGQPMEYARSAARGDLYRYFVKLKA
ncbi:GntR family transcriptional regulator [Nakamurella silvestris]|nr:GntR family transcriptional regulator [Nakamurella silvestris]